jgi:hypothetical protein
MRSRSQRVADVQLSVQWGDDAAFSESRWPRPFRNATIIFLTARRVDPSSGGVFIEAERVPSPNSRRAKTMKATRSTGPVWNEAKHVLIGDREMHRVQVVLRTRDESVGRCSTVLKQFAAGSGWVNRTYFWGCTATVDVQVKVDGLTPGVTRPTLRQTNGRPLRPTSFRRGTYPHMCRATTTLTRQGI